MPVKNQENPELESSQIAVVNSEADEQTRRIVKLLHRLAANDIGRYEQSQTLEFPFFCREDDLEKINLQICELLEQVQANVETEFISNTRFQDLSELRIDSFDAFLEKAGNNRDPESIRMQWSKFSIDSNAEPISGIVIVSFITEKLLNTQSKFENNRASVKIEVSGSDSKWVSSTLDTIIPYIDSTKLGGIYKPLWIFRSKIFIETITYILGLLGFILGYTFSNRLFVKQELLRKKDMLDKIINEVDIAKKINLFAERVLSIDNFGLWNYFLSMICGGVIMALIYLLGNNVFSRLTPNSCIAIGLAAKRSENYMNVFKFVIFGVIITGIVIPILMKALSMLFLL